MRVNQNISAVISNANLHHSENKLTASIERLSSGYKLNKAKDSPAAMAISNKMRAQIKGLDQSNKNAADGTSVMQTADGALNETHAMLQRMRELCVQAATDTMGISDKKACQNEIKELQEEIDRIAKDTEFNGKKILDGSQDYRAFPSVNVNGESKLASTYIRNFQTSDEVSAEDYKFEITNVPKQATMDFTVTAGTAGTVEINGTAVKISDTDSPDEIFAMLKEAGEYVGVQVEKKDPADPNNNQYKFTTFDYGKSAKISATFRKEIPDKKATAQGEDGKPATVDFEVKEGIDQGEIEINGCVTKILATDSADDIYKKLKEAGELAGVKVVQDTTDPNKYTFTTDQVGKEAEISVTFTDILTAEGEDTEIEMVRDTTQKTDSNGDPVVDDAGNPVLYGEGFTNTATYLSDGKKVTIRDLNGFEMIFEVEPEMDTQNVLDTPPVKVDLEMTDIGSMTLQIGTHENQIVDVRIPAATCEALYIDELNVVRKGSAEKAMRSLDDAIAQVSAIRSRIGAYQNRLDYAVTSLDGTEENMETAISRIMDTDMAEEMSVYSNMNVLNQAGISVLTQANDMPQQILQLLN